MESRFSLYDSVVTSANTVIFSYHRVALLARIVELHMQYWFVMNREKEVSTLDDYCAVYWVRLDNEAS